MTCNSKLYAIGGYDGIRNLSSVEFYAPETNQWTMVAKMSNHEGVVGVGILPHDIDSNNNSSKESSEHLTAGSASLHPSSHKALTNSSHKPFMKSYYSLMEEEEEDNQYRSTIRQDTVNFLAN